jgi:hypothetical protein
MKSVNRPVTAAKPAPTQFADKPGLAAAKFTGRIAVGKPAEKASSATARPAAKKSVDKAAVVAARAVTKPIRLAKADPLAALPVTHSVQSKDSATAR